MRTSLFWLALWALVGVLQSAFLQATLRPLSSQLPIPASSRVCVPAPAPGLHPCRPLDSNKTLYYFKTPDDVPKPNGLRGQISLVDCIIEDLDERGNVRPAIGSAMVEMQRGERASLLLRIRSLDPRRWAAAAVCRCICMRCSDVCLAASCVQATRGHCLTWWLHLLTPCSSPFLSCCCCWLGLRAQAVCEGPQQHRAAC